MKGPAGKEEKTESMRGQVRDAFATAKGCHAGLLFSRGLPERPTDPGKRGEAIQALLRKVAAAKAPALYDAAYRRWLSATADPDHFARWHGRIDGRLFLGLGGAHVLESNVALSRTYGVPLIPGSALKGLARAHAGRYFSDSKR